MDLANTSYSGYGDNLCLGSTSQYASSNTYVLWSYSKKGYAGVFERYGDHDSDVPLLWSYAYGSTSSYESFYCYGKAGGTTPWYYPWYDGEGRIYEFVTPVCKNNTIQLNGTSRLSNGTVNIAFESFMRNAISNEEEIKIFLTPKNGWSGLYIDSSSNSGFTVKSGAGDQNIEFDWFVIGVLIENEMPREMIMSPEERMKRQSIESSRNH